MHGEEEEGGWKTEMEENELSHRVIGAAIEVHRELGPGLLEALYEEALCHELYLQRLPFFRQQRVPFAYKGIKLGAEMRYDILVAGKILVEVKAREHFAPSDKPQLLSYLRLLDLRVGLLINFHCLVLKDGIKRGGKWSRSAAYYSRSSLLLILSSSPCFLRPSVSPCTNTTRSFQTA